MPDKYNGTWDTIKKNISQEGPLSLYKGVIPPLATVVPIFAIGFLGYGFGKDLVADPDQETLTGSQVLFAGLVSGASTTFITVPAERIKCLLQMQGNNTKKYNGFVDCGIKLWKEGGIRNLYIGTSATFLRDVPATGLYFCSYEQILRYLSVEPDKATWEPLLAGGCAGVVNWVVSMPFDTLKSKLQTASLGEYPRGLRSVYPAMVKKEGVSVLYRGIIPVLFRAFPANAACFWGYELCMDFLDKHIPWL
ncbi:Mitochondrial carnitine/acylcarnitine carrier protein [Dufourea novaeangliae]|uniref:Mitochondrial carnitine/acylcarnitine carrier protein n=1 Tax=Dufourea novaeangliae TaxID=178035 RepID=A0A154PHJ5_DUFNO|nr:Mitochondrial carnitine/acylcarnitine carrier protein [Dufourea novaeangliae]